MTSLKTETALQHLLFGLDQELFALPAARVREIMRFRQWTPVPGAPASLPGIISQRGAILAIVDLRVVLGQTHTDPTRATRLVVVSGPEWEIALLVDHVYDLVEYPVGSVLPIPPASDPLRISLISGIIPQASGDISLLDIDALVATLSAKTS